MNASTIKPFNIAINGFGRIGRNVLRAYIERFCQNPLQLQPLNIVAINDIAEPATLLHLLKYDSTHGRLSAVSDIHIELKTVDCEEVTVVLLKSKLGPTFAVLFVNLFTTSKYPFLVSLLGPLNQPSP